MLVLYIHPSDLNYDTRSSMWLFRISNHHILYNAESDEKKIEIYFANLPSN